MPQTSNTAFKFAPVEHGEKRVDLNIDGHEAVISLSSWVEGLGWCGEKTMRLQADMLDEIHRVIGAARIRLRQKRLEAGEEVVDGKVLTFPA